MRSQCQHEVQFGFHILSRGNHVPNHVPTVLRVSEYPMRCSTVVVVGVVEVALLMITAVIAAHWHKL